MESLESYWCEPCGAFKVPHHLCAGDGPPKCGCGRTEPCPVHQPCPPVPQEDDAKRLREAAKIISDMMTENMHLEKRYEGLRADNARLYLLLENMERSLTGMTEVLEHLYQHHDNLAVLQNESGWTDILRDIEYARALIDRANERPRGK